MEKDSKKSHSNLVHYLDDDEIENELTFFEEDGNINDIDLKSNHTLNKNNQFKRRKLFNSISTDNLRKKFNVISSPVSFIPNTSLLNNRSSQQLFTIQNPIDSNKRKSNNVYSTFANGIQGVNNSNEIDVNKPYMPIHKSIKINTNADDISSPVISASASPLCTSTPVAISPHVSQQSTAVPVRSSTPILPPSILRSEGSFSSISSISSINRSSRNESSLSSIKEDFNSPEFLSSSQSNENSVNNDIVQKSTSSPISLIKNFSNSSSQLKDKEKNISNINVRNKNFYWNLGINSNNSPSLSYNNEQNEKYLVYSPECSPILKNDNIPQNILDKSSSPIPYQKQTKSESLDSELLLFKPISWNQPLQTTIKENENDRSNDNNDKNNIPSNKLMITIDQNRDIHNESLNNVNNLSTPVSAILTQKLPFLSLNKSPDKTNNPYLTTSNAIPIPSIQRNANSMLPISPLSVSMNLDDGLVSNTNSSPTLRKEIEIPYSQDAPRYYGSLSSFSTSPSPITSSALMNGISRNNTELQSSNKYTHNNNINIELDKNNYSDLFDYKDDLLSSNSDHHDKDTITTTNSVNYNINLNAQPLDSMDVDF